MPLPMFVTFAETVTAPFDCTLSGVIEMFYGQLRAILGKRNGFINLFRTLFQTDVGISQQPALHGNLKHIALAGCQQVGVVVIHALVFLAGINFAVANAGVALCDIHRTGAARSVRRSIAGIYMRTDR